MGTSVFATLLLGCVIATVSPGKALADPLGDAAASGWVNHIADSYRGFIPPGVSPIAAKPNGAELTRRDTLCGTDDAAEMTDAARKVAMKISDITMTCGNAGKKPTTGR